ncbi:MAG TPA: orotidine-5'-phosphate decarboxylase, partial [Gammaproteobacteria bacterium]|nr:orotidine-5'-phosphate decarboxylase [Gammaproteobacteria bacterium]
IAASKIEFDVIFGSAYKGIPLSVAVARSLYEKHAVNYPYAFNRKEAKDHGEGGTLIGAELAGKRVLIVDDVLTTGMATKQSMEIIEKAGGKVVGLAVALDRREDKKAHIGDFPIMGITTLDHVLQAREALAAKENKMAQVIVPMDVENMQQAAVLAEKLDPKMCKLKVGMQLFTAEGPKMIQYFNSKGYDVFLDMKYLDIPNTVYGAVRQAADLNVWMLTVHTTGSDDMLAQAHQAVVDFSKANPGKRVPIILGVTILTSISEAELKSTFKFADMQDAVLKLALKAKQHQLDGVVCSPLEAQMIRAHGKEFGTDFVIVTPGIRLDDQKQDQVRVATPEYAVKSGSNYLVVGRPITQAKDPKAALQTFVQHIQTASIALK